MSQQQQTLEDQCIETILENLKDAYDIESLHIPRTLVRSIRKNVKKYWVNREPDVDVWTFDYESIDLWNMSLREFNITLNNPGDIQFLLQYEDCHLVETFYQYRPLDSSNNYKIPRTMCHDCFNKIRRLSPQESKERWSLDQIRGSHFRKVTKHTSIPVSEIFITVILNPKRYCDICITKPLFEFEEDYNCLHIEICSD